MLTRPLFLAACLAASVAAFSVAALAPAQALTFEEYGANGARKADDTSMFYNDGRAGTPRSNFSDGKATDTRGKSGFYFGGQSQSFDQRNNPDSYFNPNVLMGK